MRIGIDIREFEQGKFTGIGRFLGQFLLYAGTHDKENEYVLFGNQKTDFAVQSENQTLRIIPEGITIIWDQILLPQAIRKENIDVFLTPYFKAPVFNPVKSVIIINDFIPLLVPEYQKGRYFLKRFYYKNMTKVNTRRADKILTISHSTKKDLVRIFGTPPDKVDVITLAVEETYQSVTADRQAIVSKYGINKKFIFYAGNLKPHKNVRTLIDAYCQLPDNMRNEYQLVIGGKKDLNYPGLYQCVQEMNMTEHILFTDCIPEEELLCFHNAASIFVFPSLYEGFGLPVLEAMACGTPVITSNISSLPEVAGDAALLIDPHQPEELVAAIKRVITDQQLRDDLINKGIVRAKIFSKANMSDQIISALKEVYAN